MTFIGSLMMYNNFSVTVYGAQHHVAQVTNVKHKTSIINQYECHFSSKLHIYVYKVQSSCPQSLIPSTFLHSYIVLLVLVLSISINISINITINQSGGVKLVLCAHAENNDQYRCNYVTFHWLRN
jgi:hypothetical protein